MILTHVLTFNRAMVALAAEAGGELALQEQNQDGRMELVAIELAEHASSEKYDLEDFLKSRNGHASALGILGMNHVGQSLARQARRNFGMQILYHAAQPVPAIEAACGARFASAAEMRRRADLCSAVLPLSRETQHLLDSALQTQRTVFLTWQRSPPIERALAYMAKHYDRCLRLEELAAVVGLDKFHLLRLFAATVGITPHRYQMLLRVAHAKSLLRGGERISEVAYRVGFYDQSHFTRHFRHMIGMTPGQYQKNGLG